MSTSNSKIVGEGLTYDDVLLVPAYSEVLPREVYIASLFSSLKWAIFLSPFSFAIISRLPSFEILCSTMQKYVFFSFLLSVSELSAQIVGGFSGIYNFQTESFGIGARVVFPEQKKIQFSPQFSYFIPGNQVHEWTAGAAVQYRFFELKKIQTYTLAHLGYNRWLNFEDSPAIDAKLNNWNGELGFGVILGKNTRPFVEWRYNTRHREALIHVGLLFNKNSFKPKKEKCAAYD